MNDRPPAVAAVRRTGEVLIGIVLGAVVGLVIGIVVTIVAFSGHPHGETIGTDVEWTLGIAAVSFVVGIVLTRKVNLGFGMFVIANGVAIAIPLLLAGAALIVNHIYHTWL